MDNQNQNYYNSYQPTAIVQDSSRTFLMNVYNWMAMGLAITGIVAYFVSEAISLRFIAEHIFIFYGLLIFEVLLVFGLSAAINKIPAIVAIGVFFIYAFVNGLTMSVLFLAYTRASVYSTFFICAAMFGSVSVFGYITKMDLTKIGGFLIMGVIGLVIASIVNIFMESSTLYWIISYAGVIIFVGLTAYDTQRIKRYAREVDAHSEEGKKGAIFGALNLYLDFINMFIFLLRILGSRR